MQTLEPLQFKPALKERIWGGPCRKEFLPADMAAVCPDDAAIGEYWFIYDRPEGSSVVRSGTFQGKTLHELIEEYGTAAVIGKDVHETVFPVMIKILNARDVLSVQVHPDQNNPFGEASKNEVWYPLEFGPDAGFIIGVQPGISEREFWDSIYDGKKLRNMLQFHPAAKETCYLIPAGCIHALGKNCVVLEIQENSDATYRISDWGRRTAEGTFRELHQEKAQKTADFGLNTKLLFTNRETSFRQDGMKFALQELSLDQQKLIQTVPENSFHILSPVSGDIRLNYRAKEFLVKYGDCILVPACCGSYGISAVGDTATVLQTYRS